MVLASVLLLVQAQNPIQQIIDISKRDNRVMAHLRELCFDIGARPTGSPEYTRATKWAMDKFKSFGIENAHLEKWGEVSVGFSRGPNNWGKMVEPFAEEIIFTTNCWMPGTDGPKRGRVVFAPKNMNSFDPKALKGAWVLVDTPGSMRGANTDKEDTALREAINGAGILGRVYSAQAEYVHTHGTWKGKTFEKRPKTVEILVRKSDFERMARNVRFGRDTVVEFNADNRWQKGPIDVHNVVAEIRGSEKPDEIVIVGGHIDSWNSPGSQGACDNGTGTSSTLEAARILMLSGLKPKRTIRFILFGGEEQGLLGSEEYVKQHIAEMPKVSACLVDDGGSNYESGVSGLEVWRPFFEPTFDLMTKNFPDMPMKFNPVTKYNSNGGSDQASFNARGIPAFFMGKAGRQKYVHIWHTQHDKYEEAIPEYLRQVSTSLAVNTFAIANAPTMMPRQ